VRSDYVEEGGDSAYSANRWVLLSLGGIRNTVVAITAEQANHCALAGYI
jgi:hypothetical protein